jgi:hypothetical protein
MLCFATADFSSWGSQSDRLAMSINNGLHRITNFSQHTSSCPVFSRTHHRSRDDKSWRLCWVGSLCLESTLPMWLMVFWTNTENVALISACLSQKTLTLCAKVNIRDCWLAEWLCNSTSSLLCPLWHTHGQSHL